MNERCPEIRGLIDQIARGVTLPDACWDDVDSHCGMCAPCEKYKKDHGLDEPVTPLATLAKVRVLGVT